MLEDLIRTILDLFTKQLCIHCNFGIQGINELNFRSNDYASFRKQNKGSNQ